MAATAPPSITALPTPPDPANRATFAGLAYPWAVAQQTAATQLGAVNANLAANAAAAYAAAQAAEADAAATAADKLTADASAATAFSQASAATTAATTAGTQASAATTQATAATAAGTTAQARAAEATAAAQAVAALNARTSTGHPTSRPALALDFANTQRVDPRITFTRASTATRVNSRGLLEAVASGAPRIDYDPITMACRGLLIEESRTNLLTWSDHPRIGMGAWQSTLIDTAIPTPYGAGVAAKLVENATNNSHNANAPTSVTSGTTYTFSVFVKAAERTSAAIVLNTNNSAFAFAEVSVDLTTGACAVLGGSPPSYGAAPFPGGWWRLHITGTATATAVGVPSIGMRTTSSVYAGDGTSGIYIYGPQMEAGAFPTSYIPSSVTHTGRASTATFIGSNGLIQTAASGVARYSYNPLNLAAAPALLLEAAATNLLLRSEEFDNATWGKWESTISANATTAPDGASTADKLVENTTPTQPHHTSQVVGTISGTYTISVYLKAAGRTKGYIQLYASGGNAAAFFDLQAGTITTSTGTTSIQSVGNGWYRVAATNTFTSSSATVYIVLNNDAGQSTYTGDGTSGVFLWGAQVEQGSYPTSYIPTTSAQATRAADTSTSATATRAADVATMTGSNFSSWYRQDEGTFLVGSRADHTADTYMMSCTRGAGTWGPRFQLTNSRQPTVNSLNDASAVDATLGTALASNPQLAAFSYRQNDYVLSASGAAVQTDTAVSVPTGLADLRIGSSPVGLQQLNGHIRSLHYWPQRLHSAQLRALTAQ